MKIAVITVPKYTHYERIGVNNRPWLKNIKIPQSVYFKHEDSVTKDYAVYAYLKYHYPNQVESISIKKAASSPNWWKTVDYIYWGCADYVTAFYSPIGKGGLPLPLAQQYKKLLKKYSSKLLGASFDFSNFIVHKCKYYDFLKKNKIPVADYTCALKTNTLAKNKSLIKTFTEKYISPGIFLKPSGGYAGIDTYLVQVDNGKTMVNDEVVNKKPLDAVYDIAFKLLKKYDEVVVAKFIEDFPYTLEARFFFLGDKLEYILFNDSKGDWYKPQDIPDKVEWWIQHKKIDIEKLKRLAMKTFKLVLKTYFKKTIPVHIRIDLGCCLKPKQYSKHFVNEIEFGHGWVEFMDRNQFMIPEKIGKAIIKGTNLK